MKLYHASDKAIAAPVYENGLKHSITKTKHDNGVIGLWCSTTKDWADILGPGLYKFSAEGKIFDISIEELESKDSKFAYSILREHLLAKGIDIIRVVYEDDEYNDQTFIIVNFDVIKNWKET